jgi:septum formation protein
MIKKQKIILASKSSRRKQLLSRILDDFTIIDSNLDESKIKIDEPSKYCKNLSYLKAKTVSKNFKNDIIIGADTIVYLNNIILGKPKDYNEAFNMLKKLSGQTHTVFTGVSILSINKKININFSEKTNVTFYDIPDNQIDWYIKNNNPYDKAGSYGIQDGSQLFVKVINGNYENVIGLPISKIYRYFIELKLINL